MRDLRLQVENLLVESSVFPDDFQFFDLLDAEHVIEHRRRMENPAKGGGLEAARMAAIYSFRMNRRRDVLTLEATAMAARDGRGESEGDRRRRKNEEEEMLRAVRRHIEGDTLQQHLQPRDPRARKAERAIHNNFCEILRGRREDETDL